MLTLFLPYNLTNNKSCYESCRLAFSSRRRWSAEVHLKKLLAKLLIPLEVWPCPRITQRHRPGHTASSVASAPGPTAAWCLLHYHPWDKDELSTKFSPGKLCKDYHWSMACL